MDQVVRKTGVGPRAFVEGLSTGAFAGLTLAVVGGPLLGTLAASGVADAVLVGVAAAGGVIAAVAGVHRRRTATLPLEFAEAALRGKVSGCDAYRFRIRLGHGRLMRNASAEVAFVGDDGAEVPLRPVMPSARVLLGPWTVVVLDPLGVHARSGSFRVRVRAEERGRVWQSERSWPAQALRAGRFEAALRRRGGRLVWDRGAWDSVVDDS